MSNQPIIRVQPLTPEASGDMVDYFLKSEPSYLRSLGVDITKLPSKTDWLSFLTDEYTKAFPDKKYFCLGWEYDGQPIGHSSLDPIIYGKEAWMHLHIWHPHLRRQGLGSIFLAQSVAYYFEHFKLQQITCRPMAINDAPNKTLQKLGFQLIDSFETIPHRICFKQCINQYRLDRKSGIFNRDQGITLPADQGGPLQ